MIRGKMKLETTNMYVMMTLFKFDLKDIFKGKENGYKYRKRTNS